jgi:hypothetical protein
VRSHTLRSARGGHHQGDLLRQIGGGLLGRRLHHHPDQLLGDELFDGELKGTQLLHVH